MLEGEEEKHPEQTQQQEEDKFPRLRRGKDTFTRAGAVITFALDVGRLVGWRP